MAVQNVLVAAAAVFALAGASSPLPASNLKVEYVVDPIVLDVAIPRFFWLVNHADRAITQSSYRIMVNSSTTGTTAWDSGVVPSGATTQVEYAGAAITSDTVYVWAVQWTDSNGVAAAWSSPARFGTGLMTQAEWTPSAWIGCPLNGGTGPNFNQLRAEFDLGSAAGVTITQARMYITSVGYYLVRVNGNWAPVWSYQRPRLDPGWTTYEVRSYYNAFDLTNVLVPNGPNALAVMLGNGWPDISPVPGNSTRNTVALDESGHPDSEALVAARIRGPAPFTENAGELRQARIQVRVHTSDGKVQTWVSTAGGFQREQAAGGAWQCGAGANQYDSVYNGNTVDARLETTGWDLPNYAYAGNWTAALLKADPGGAVPTTMTAQTFPSITVQSELPAQTMASPAPGVYVFDFGQNLAGVVRLTIPAPVAAGITVTMRHAELLQHPPYGPKDGNIYVGNLRSARATDVYTTAGTSDGASAEVYEPIFTFHGFRFVEVSGLPPSIVPTLSMVTALYMRTGEELAGNVVFPSETANTLNQLQHAVTWGIGCNMYGVQSDCPQRDERKGWMGDSGLSLMPSHYNYAIGAWFTFWAQNIRDNQMYGGDSHPAGSVSDTVPHTFGNYPSDPAWGTAYPGVVYSTWRFYGDTRIAIDHYPNLQAYIAFMTGETNKSGVAKIYQSYGDWCPPPPTEGGGQGPKPPTSYTSGLAFLTDLQRIIEIATALGKSADAASYQTYRDFLIDGFNTAWLNATSGKYGSQNGDGLQTANAAAIGVNAANAAGAKSFAAVAGALVTDLSVTHAGHWATGIIGMRYLPYALTTIGSGKLAIDTLLTTDYPGYGYEFNHPDEPATTLWELPDGPSEGPGMNSRNHHMFASVGGWLYQDLAGIDQTRTFDSAYNPADPTQHGFQHAILFPRVTDHPNLGYLEAEYNSIAGPFAVSWINPNSSSASSGTCTVGAPENSPVTFSCPPGGGTFVSVVFASFGTPTGACGSFAVGSCNAANSTAIVSAACLGKSTCTINVADTLFGDPCFDTVKVLDAQLACTTPTGVQVIATVPTNARATVRLPLPAGANPATITVSEGATVVWTNGAYQSGAVGVSGATVGSTDLPAGQVTLDIQVASGTYSFSSA